MAAAFNTVLLFMPYFESPPTEFRPPDEIIEKAVNAILNLLGDKRSSSGEITFSENEIVEELKASGLPKNAALHALYEFDQRGMLDTRPIMEERLFPAPIEMPPDLDYVIAEIFDPPQVRRQVQVDALIVTTVQKMNDFTSRWQQGKSITARAAVPEARRKTRGRTPPSKEEIERDRRIFQQWTNGAFAAYKDLARVRNSTADEIKRSIDRHRKRQLARRKKSPEQ